MHVGRSYRRPTSIMAGVELERGVDPQTVRGAQLDIVQRLVDGSVDADHAAEKLDALFPTKQPACSDSSKYTPEHYVFELWSSLLTWGTAVPAEHEGQAAIVSAMQRLQKLHTDDLDGARVWEDVPRLPWALREVFQLHGEATDEPGFTNTSALYARIAQSGLYDTLDFGVIRFREALEEAVPAEQVPAHMSAVSQWLQYAGQLLFNGGKPSHESSRLCSPGSLWQGPGGLNPERWAFWKQRLGQLGQGTLLEAMEKAAR